MNILNCVCTALCITQRLTEGHAEWGGCKRSLRCRAPPRVVVPPLPRRPQPLRSAALPFPAVAASGATARARCRLLCFAYVELSHPPLVPMGVHALPRINSHPPRHLRNQHNHHYTFFTLRCRLVCRAPRPHTHPMLRRIPSCPTSCHTRVPPTPRPESAAGLRSGDGRCHVARVGVPHASHTYASPCRVPLLVWAPAMPLCDIAPRDDSLGSHLRTCSAARPVPALVE